MRVPITTPSVTVVMPVRNEAGFIERALHAVTAQQYPRKLVEIIVADGLSKDGTREIVERLALGDNRIRLIDNPGRIAPTALNAALAQAKGDVIVRVDGHCEIAPDYIRCAVEHLLKGQDENVGGVGGPLETIGTTRTARAIACAMSSPFGVGNSAFRTMHGRMDENDMNNELEADTVAFPTYWRSVIERAGPFDEELVRNQDDEYNYRLRKLGVRILLAGDVKARYYSRSSFSRLRRQYYQYGYWKVRVMQKHTRQMSMRQFVPPAFVAALLLSAITAPFISPWPLILIVGAYLIANLCAAAITAKRNASGVQALALVPALALAFATLHISYGAGFLRGLLAFRYRWGDHHTRASAYWHTAAATRGM